MSALGQKQTFAMRKGMSALPPKATSNATYGMSALGQKRTWRTLLNHFVGAGEQRWRHGKTERLGGLEIDGELKFGGLLNRELGRFRSLENTINISRSLLPQVVIVDPIRNQTAVRHKKAVRVDCRQPQPCRKVGDQFVVN